MQAHAFGDDGVRHSRRSVYPCCHEPLWLIAIEVGARTVVKAPAGRALNHWRRVPLELSMAGLPSCCGSIRWVHRAPL